MIRAAALAPLAALGVLLSGCGALHVNDHAFGAPPGTPFGASAGDPTMADDAGPQPSHAARVARLLHLPKDRPFGPAGAVYGPYGAIIPGRKGAPPCKFGGTRCPPWERAWPAQSGLAPADVVTADGRVILARKPTPVAAVATGAGTP